MTGFVLSIGVVNIPTGKTMYDWSIYEHGAESEVYLANNVFLLYGAKGSLKCGDKLTIRDNDSQRKIKDAEITDLAECTYEKVIEMLERNGFDYKPIRAFQKRKSSRKLMTSYSIKGITE
jgi:hypothetical protein